MTTDVIAGRPPRVVQCCVGKFHHFDLARELHRHGALEAIFTGYPRWKLRDEGVAPDRIRSFPWVQTVNLGKRRFGLTNAWLDRELDWLAHESIDRHCARNLPACDVFVALSGSGLNAGQAALRMGARFVCDRGSAHIRSQDQLLRAEFARWGEAFMGVDPRSVEKEEREYELADVVTIPSQFARRTFLDRGVPAGKMRVIPYGVSLEKFRPTAEPPADGFDVLAAGQVSFRKGVPYLLDAFQQLRHPAKSLTFVGGVTREIKSWLRTAPLKDVRLAGPVPQARLAEMFARAHVLVLASVEDGFGLVLAQAMACGCPCIATTSSGGPDLITDGVDGFLVPPGDASAIRARLEQLAGDRTLRDRLGAAALETVRRLGGWREYGEQWMNLCGALTREPVPCS